MSKGYAIVTGASRGIGKAIFLELAKEGYDLLGVYTSKGSASKMQDLIDQAEKENGVKAFSFQADVGKADDCKALVDYAKKKPWHRHCRTDQQCRDPRDLRIQR